MMDPDPAPNPTKKPENVNFVLFFLYKKKYFSPKYDLFFFIYGVNIYFSKHNFQDSHQCYFINILCFQVKGMTLPRVGITE